MERPNHLITRRNILRGIPALGAAALVGCAEVQKKELEPTPSLEPELSPTPKELEYTTRIFGDVHLKLDSEQLPVSFTRMLDSGNSEEVEFNRQAIFALRDAAVANNSPQFFESIPVKLPEKTYTFSPSLEHPKVESLPEDVLSTEEIKARGVNITQGNQTSLYIRENAFEKDGPLEAFDENGMRLNIVLIDGPIVHTAFMKDPKYSDLARDKVWLGEIEFNAILPTPEHMRNVLQEKCNQNLENFKSARSDDYQILEQLATLSKIEKVDESILTKMYIESLETKILGMHIMNYSTAEAFIFLAAGGFEPDSDLVIGFDSYGNPSYQVSSTEYFPSPLPWPYNTHPNPNDFTPIAGADPNDPKSYLYAGQSLGFTFWHELMHNKLMIQDWYEFGTSNSSEYDTDVAAMNVITNASNIWRSSDFKDDSGYYFAFSVLPERGGSYIITQKLGENKGLKIF